MVAGHRSAEWQDDRGAEWRGVALAIAGVATLAVLALGGLAMVSRQVGRDAAWPDPAAEARSVETRLVAIDDALTRGDLPLAMHEWHDAYGIALGSRRWEAMATVGDAALGIDALAGRVAGQGSGFRAEARRAYLRTLFAARAARSPEGIRRAADAFAALGDADMAARARALAQDP